MSLVSLAGKGRDDKLRSALEKDASGVNAANGRGVTPLLAAVEQGEEECVAVLLEAGADPSVAGRDAVPPLLLAAQLGFEDIALVLLEAQPGRAAAETRDASGLNLAHLALRHRMPALLDAVVRRAPATLREAAEGAAGMTPLVLAASLGATEAVGDLLRARGRTAAEALRDGTDAAGNTVMHWAARKGDTDAMRLYAGHGARADAANARGQTPMHLAYEQFRGNAGGLARVLEELGADREARDADGLRPEDVVAALEREDEAGRAEAAAADEERRQRAKFRRQARQQCDAEVLAWLRENSLDEHEAAFGRRGMTMDDVRELSSATLGKMGVELGARPPVLAAVEAVLAADAEARRQAEADAARELERHAAGAKRTRMLILAGVLAFFVAVFFFLRWVEQRGTPVRLGGGSGRSYTDDDYSGHEANQ